MRKTTDSIKQNLMISSGKVEREKKYWLKKLSGQLTIGTFLYDDDSKINKAWRENPGSKEIFRFPEQLYREILRIGNRSEYGVFIILATGLSYLVSKYSGKNDIIIGMPILMKDKSQSYFNEMLPLRIAVMGKMTFKDLLFGVKQTVSEAVVHMNYPMERIVKQMDLPPHIHHIRELCDTFILFKNIHGEDIDVIKEQKCSCIFVFDMTDQYLKGELHYHSTLNDDIPVKQLWKHFMNFFPVITRDPMMRLSDIEILTRDEKNKILYDFNNTYAQYPKNKTIHQLFAEQVDRTPDNIALEYQGSDLTYTRLNKRANQLAGFLQEKGVKSGSIVGIMMERSIEYIIGIFAIIKAGGTLLPLDPMYPGDRLRFMLNDANSKIILVKDDQTGKIVGFSGLVINLRGDWGAIAGQCNGNNKINDNTGGNPAYLVYTSGSTGTPKGVVGSHHGAVNRFNWMWKRYAFKPNEICCQKTSISFVDSIWEIFGPLLKGIPLVIIAHERLIDIPKFVKILRKKCITRILLVPSLLKVLLDPGSRYYEDLTGLEIWLLLSETLSIDLQFLFKKYLPESKLLYIYGSSEVSADVTCFDTSREKIPGRRVPIGYPIDNSQIYILDKNMSLVPFGAAGEIYIGGVGLSYGYLNQPELTFEHYVPNIFSSRKGSRLYKSGDLGRVLPDGTLEFLGRVDHLVKIRGFRIEPGEIEAQLLKHKDIKDAVVISRTDKSGDEFLCAYFTARHISPRVWGVELREYLSHTLPDYMIPSFFLLLDKLPLTPTGKIDRRALPEPLELDPGAMGVDYTYTAPRDAIEKKLTEIWKEILWGRDVEAAPDSTGKQLLIGIDNNFFQLGGHSLRAVSLFARIHKTFNIEIPLAFIFKSPTIRKLSEYIKDAEKNIYVSIKPIEKKEYYPSSSAQKRLYILQQMDETNTSYNLPAVFNLEGNVDREKLEDIFKKLIQRHESLRTSFHIEESQPVQSISDETEFKIEYYEEVVNGQRSLVIGDERSLVNVNDSEGTRGLAPLSIEYAASNRQPETDLIGTFIRPFDLSQPPLIRVGLIKTAVQEHILMVDMHHIISDGLSIDIIIKEFRAFFQDKVMPALHLSYKDFSQWQKCLEESERIKEQETFWTNQMEGEIPTLDLPFDYPRPAVQKFAGGRINFVVEKEQALQLKQLNLETDTTTFVVLAAAFNIFLARLSQQEQILIGTPIAGRTHMELENIIGMFVNTLVLRSYPTKEKKLRRFLQEVKQDTLNALANQDYQYEDLVDRVVTTRDMSRNPLFDVMFVLRNLESAEAQPPGLKISPYSYEHKSSKFDMTLNVDVFAEESLFFELEYSTALFKKETIEKFIKYFKNILSCFPGSLEKKISELEMISEEEMNRLLYDFNDTRAEYPVDKTIQELFAEQAERTPDHIVLIDTGHRVQGAVHGSITYDELNKRSDQLGCLLKQKGVKPGFIVGIMMERSLLQVTAIIAVLKVGAAFLALDPTYPVERLAFMIKDAHLPLVLTSGENPGPGTDFGGLSFCLDSDWQGRLIVSADVDNSASGFEVGNHIGEEPAYIIYTSGSTGTPKGVLALHRGVINRCSWMWNAYPFKAYDVCCQKTSMNFVDSIWEIFGPLLKGVSSVIISDKTVIDIPRLVQILKTRRVTRVAFVPGLLYRLFDGVVQYYKELSDLRFWVSSGEVLTKDFPGLFRKLMPGSVLLNLYGSSEVSADVTYYDASAEEKHLSRVPIGRPINNTRIYILDESQSPVSIGIVGEIYVGGAGLAAGYLNQPELTMEKFDYDFWDYQDKKKKENKKFLEVQEPFFKKVHGPRKAAGGKMYKTGDLARWLSDGTIEYIGRKDHQVKIRGFRIELGEVESHLLALNGIKEVAVVARNDKNREKYLCAYVVTNEDQTVDVRDIRRQLSNKLPDYMIPLFFVPLDKMPLTSTGKIHRNVLPEPHKEGIIPACQYTPPGNDIEGKLVEIWSDLLEVDKNIIGIDANFFEMGGHSLRAVTLISIIHKEFDVVLPLSRFFLVPTVRELGEVIGKSHRTTYIPIKPLEKREYYVLSSAQKRMYIIQQLDKNSKAYNMTDTIIFGGKIAKDKLAGVFQRIIHRHESLRTSFGMKAGEPVQRVHDKVDFDLKYLEVSEEDINKSIESFEHPFDLSDAPLFRAGLIKLEKEKHILVVNIHHIVSDGTTLNIFMKEFGILYKGERLPKLTIQYKDFAAWQNHLIQSGGIDKQERYWLEKYKNGVRTLDLPTDYVRTAVQSFTGSLIHFNLDEQQTETVKQFALKKNATLFMVLLSVFNILMAKLSGQEEIVLGTPVAGRNRHEDLEQLIGLFLNTLLLENLPRRDKTFNDFLMEVKENTIEAFENQDYQFEDLVEKVIVDRNASRNPLFDVMFVLRNMEQPDVEIPDLKIAPYEYDNGTTKLDILLNGIESGGKLCFYIRYCKKIYKRKTIERFIGYFKQAFDFVLEYPGKKISEIEMITTAEKERLLFDFNDTSPNYPGNITIQELFEDRVERVTDQSAVVYNLQRMTYGELNERVNRLAHYLRDHYHVKSNQVMGVSLDRSLEMIIAVLGIIKSGAGYVAVDPNYPRERVDHILKDSGVQQIITDGNAMNNVLLEGFSGEKIDIKGDWDKIQLKSPENPTIINQPDDLLYVIYTSGSTGTPNGALLSHDLLTNLIQWQDNHTSINSSLRVLQFTTINFCVSFQEIMCTLTAGGEVYLIGDMERQEIDYLMNFLVKHGIEILYLPFSYLNFLFNESHRWNENFDHSLKHIITAGEQLKISRSMKLFLENNPDLRLHNHYGSSEMHVVTSFTLDHTLAVSHPIPPAGKPIANTKIYILDDNLKPVPIGVWGELFVESRRELLGYVNNDRLTNTKMVYVPELSWKRLYRSGDIGRWLEDGNIQLGGRKDFQVKVRGFRVEPGEIESKILAIEGVKDCVVVVKEDRDHQQGLYAYVVLEYIDIIEVKKALGNLLPQYMIPRLISLESLPLMPNGKVDRDKLPEPGTDFEKAQSDAPPRNHLEKKIAHIWQEVLGVEHVGIHTSFFDLGGNSLRSIKVNNQLKEILQKDIPLVKMFEYTTISELALYLVDTKDRIDHREIKLDKMVSQAKIRMKKIIKH